MGFMFRMAECLDRFLNKCQESVIEDTLVMGRNAKMSAQEACNAQAESETGSAPCLLFAWLRVSRLLLVCSLFALCCFSAT